MLALLGGVVYGLQKVDDRIFGEDVDPGEEVTVRIPEGSNSDEIAHILEDAGVVDSATKFEARLVLAGDGDSLKPGSYKLRTNEDYDIIVRELSTGPPSAPVQKLVVPEGFSTRDIAARVAKLGTTSKAYLNALKAADPPQGFLEKGESSPQLEGFLFPAVYEVQPPVKPKALIEQQVATFEDKWSQIDMAYARSKGLSKYDVLIIASMIEREAAAPGDRAKISAVIYNRLAAYRPLGIDPTLQYANGNWKPLKPADLERPGPYNSRLNKGLPPTPIANPGLASLKAAAKPAKQPYLYFVAIPGDEKRRHFFTDDYDEFLQFQRDNPPEGTGAATDDGTSQDGAAAGDTADALVQ
jgi:UPF0755 protein